MTIEFPDDVDTVAAPATDRRRARSGLPWVLPAALAALALFLPVTTSVVANPGNATGAVTGTFRVTLYPFGGVAAAGVASRGATGAPLYGWVWVALLVGFVAVGVGSALLPGTAWWGVAAAVVGGVGVGSVATLLVSIDAGSAARAADSSLATGGWLALASAVVGLVLGLLAVRQSARANAAG